MSDLDSISNASDIENSDVSDDSENEYVFSGEYLPYQNEPLASESESSSQDDDELDEDGLSVEILRQRYEKEVPVDKWCTCGKCNHLHLVGAREYRCCREVIECVGKYTYIGQNVGCITDHEDFSSLTNRTVLLEVATLLRNKDGKRYRRQPGNTENQ
ncbi:Hypothetical predicted protein [Paramuricea clavata]|uniref:Uncharacterized protein n=1 Tax=Paramuricea clavata TaxID=317549 RepID=A0A7D9I3V9_PARCT|nr:Hypothetical predicted protein [Paramuricea clavata]